MNDDLQEIRKWLDGFNRHYLGTVSITELLNAFHSALDEIEKLRFTLEEVATEELEQARASIDPRDEGRDYDKYEAEDRRQRFHPLYPEARR